MSVSGNLSFNFSVVEQITAGVVSPQNLPAAFGQNVSYANGTGPGQLDLMHAKQYTLSATPTTIDLTSLLDLAGASINFARVREFVAVVQDTTSTHVVTISGGASNPWAPIGTGIIAPAATSATQSAPIRIPDPYSTGAGVGNVVGSTSKTVKLDPGSNTVVINIYLFGCSAVS